MDSSSWIVVVDSVLCIVNSKSNRNDNDNDGGKQFGKDLERH